MCVCVCVCVCVCLCWAWGVSSGIRDFLVCVCVCVGRGEFSQPASHGGDLVAVGSRLPERIHSSLMASRFPGFIWGAEDGEFLLGTNPAGQAGC